MISSKPVFALGPESHKQFVTESGHAIDSVCVVTSYDKVSGVAVGPDGKGRESSKERYLLKPFIYASAENFYAKLVPNKTVILPIPPIFAFGEALIPDQILFIKPGYFPLQIRGNNRYKTEILIMKTDAGKRTEAVVDALLKRNTMAKQLTEYFLKDDAQAGSLVIDYSEADDKVLRSCLAGN